MKPTIGRIVHFHDVDNATGELSTYAALISAVREGGEEGNRARFSDDDERQYVVDLVTFGSFSVYFQHDREFASEPSAGTWSWPPQAPRPSTPSLTPEIDAAIIRTSARPPSDETLKVFERATATKTETVPLADGGGAMVLEKRETVKLPDLAVDAARDAAKAKAKAEDDGRAEVKAATETLKEFQAAREGIDDNMARWKHAYDPGALTDEEKAHLTANGVEVK